MVVSLLLVAVNNLFACNLGTCCQPPWVWRNALLGGTQSWKELGKLHADSACALHPAGSSCHGSSIPGAPLLSILSGWGLLMHFPSSTYTYTLSNEKGRAFSSRAGAGPAAKWQGKMGKKLLCIREESKPKLSPPGQVISHLPTRDCLACAAEGWLVLKGI